MANFCHWLVDQTFNKWTVISFGDNRWRHIRWKCVCACGNESLISSRDLIKGRSTQCRPCREKEFYTMLRVSPMTRIEKRARVQKRFSCISDMLKAEWDVD
jgi:hypothetical protein